VRTRLTAAVLALLVGCGVPVSDEAETASGEDVPYGLLAAETGATTTSAAASATTATIWLVGDGGIVAADRDVEPPVDLVVVLGALEAGPTDAEARFGARSSVPTDAVGDADVSSEIATIDLLQAFASAGPREQLLSLAQLVYTATEIDGITAVSFTLDGQPVDVPRGDGSVSDGPVRRRDYVTLLAG
jgi:hypothetical protein